MEQPKVVPPLKTWLREATVLTMALPLVVANFLYGTIFKICGGKTTVLHSFDRGPDGGSPKGSLVLASNGSFYGMTSEGGTNGNGTIFKITASGNYSVLRNLNSTTDGGAPQASLIQGLDGNLYGMAT
jgi:uncharacterized repeat protein (TIGR03803 family)